MEPAKAIPGFDKYHATRGGEILSFRRLIPRILRGGISSRGYRLVKISHSRGEKLQSRYVHRLVALAYHGECPSGLQVSHVNGDKLDNRPENLIYESQTDNNRRKAEHGTDLKGEKHPQARLSNAKVTMIRTSGLTTVALSSLFDVSQTMISLIKRRKRWGHI